MEDARGLRRQVDMGNSIHPLFAYHPASALGSLLSGPVGGVAKQDAEPLPEQPDRVARIAAVAERVAVLFRRPRAASA
jgi:hypothetical protein